jgi:hypothetical protein
MSLEILETLYFCTVDSPEMAEVFAVPIMKLSFLINPSFQIYDCL